VFSNDFVWNKAISSVIREQVLHIKMGRILIKRATAYVETFNLKVFVGATQENK